MADEDNYDDEPSDLPAALRKQLKEKDKALKELTDKFEAVARRDRDRTLTDAFSEKGFPVKAAKFFPKDVEVTADSVNEWALENAELFGLKLIKDEQQPPAVPDAYGRLAAITAPSVSSGSEADLLHQVSNMNEADLVKLITQHGGGAS